MTVKDLIASGYRLHWVTVSKEIPVLCKPEEKTRLTKAESWAADDASAPTVSNEGLDTMKTATYSQLLEAAQTLLSQWFERARFVHISGGVLDPCDVVEDSLRTWPITDPDVPALLVASVLMGHRYHGWSAALREVQSRCERGAREKGSAA